jgi:uncharacterized membrane protein
MRVPRWITPVTLASSIAGVVVSAYLTIAHYTNPEIIACSSSGTVNCEQVTTSAQSTFLGVPVAVLGLAFFVGMTALSSPKAWRADRKAIHEIRLGAAVVGVGFVLWLVYAELFIIRAICLWCTVAHVLAFVLFVAVVLTAPDLLLDPSPEDEPEPPP